MIATIKKWWQGHGTKILGVLVMAIGVAGDSLSLIQAVDPKHAALWSLIVGVGGFIVKRGFTNTANAAALPPPSPEANR